MSNYITTMQADNAALRARLATVAQFVAEYRQHLQSPKFQGVEADGSRKDWIATADVQAWLNELAAVSEADPAPAVISRKSKKAEAMEIAQHEADKSGLPQTLFYARRGNRPAFDHSAAINPRVYQHMQDAVVTMLPARFFVQ